jgi:hypothetical protein
MKINENKLGLKAPGGSGTGVGLALPFLIDSKNK